MLDHINLHLVNVKNAGVLATLQSTVGLQPAAHYVLNLVMNVQNALHNHVHVLIVADLIMYSIEAAQPTNLRVK